MTLRLLRESAALSQQEVADALGVERSYIAKFETQAAHINDQRLEKYIAVCVSRANQNWETFQTLAIAAASGL